MKLIIDEIPHTLHTISIHKDNKMTESTYYSKKEEREKAGLLHESVNSNFTNMLNKVTQIC